MHFSSIHGKQSEVHSQLKASSMHQNCCPWRRFPDKQDGGRFQGEPQPQCYISCRKECHIYPHPSPVSQSSVSLSHTYTRASSCVCNEKKSKRKKHTPMILLILSFQGYLYLHSMIPFLCTALTLV